MLRSCVGTDTPQPATPPHCHSAPNCNSRRATDSRDFQFQRRRPRARTPDAHAGPPRSNSNTRRRRSFRYSAHASTTRHARTSCNPPALHVPRLPSALSGGGRMKRCLRPVACQARLVQMVYAVTPLRFVSLGSFANVTMQTTPHDLQRALHSSASLRVYHRNDGSRGNARSRSLIALAPPGKPPLPFRLATRP